MRITPVKRKTLFRYNITGAELARRLELSKSEICKIMTGTRHTPHIQEAVAKYFKRSVEELFGRGAWMKVYKKRGRVKAQNHTPPRRLAESRHRRTAPPAGGEAS